MQHITTDVKRTTGCPVEADKSNRAFVYRADAISRPSSEIDDSDNDPDYVPDSESEERDEPDYDFDRLKVGSEVIDTDSTDFISADTDHLAKAIHRQENAIEYIKPSACALNYNDLSPVWSTNNPNNRVDLAMLNVQPQAFDTKLADLSSTDSVNQDSNDTALSKTTDASLDKTRSRQEKVTQSTKLSAGAFNHLFKVIPTNNTTDRVYDKKFYCLFCKSAQSKLPRHLTNKHRDEKEVQLYMQEKDTKLKNDIIKKLRNLGNHQHNMKVIRENKGSLMVKYRPADADQSEEYIPCEYCYGYYKSSELWKHVKRCTLATCSSSLRSRRVVQSSRLLLPVPQEASEGLKAVLATLSSDDVSRIVKSDSLILKLGEKMFKRHGHDKEQYSILRTRMRELARLLRSLRHTSGKPNASLDEFINPSQFQAVLEATKDITGFSSQENTFKTPSLSLKIGHALKKCCKIMEGEALESGDEDKQRRSASFHQLIEMNWNDEISTHALRTIGERKRNKVKLLPLTKDVKLLNEHLKTKGKDAHDALNASHNNATAWMDLSRISLALIILFNRRRQGEVSKMTISDLNQQHSGNEEDVVNALSSFEKTLCTIFSRIEIIGKRGRTVPVILTDEIKTWLKLLVQTRTDVGVHPDNNFIFARLCYGSLGHIRGSDCLREFGEDCGANHPNLLRSTKLRFQIATLSQILNLKDHELDLLAYFLGHDIRVHREFYRLPEHTLQVAKVSKIQMAMESGQITKQAGKTLDEINIDAEEGKLIKLKS